MRIDEAGKYRKVLIDGRDCKDSSCMTDNETELEVQKEVIAMLSAGNGGRIEREKQEP